MSNLTGNILVQIPDLVKHLNKQDLPDGVIDVQVIHTSYDDETDTCNKVVVGVELIQLVDGEWVLEDMYMNGESVFQEVYNERQGM